MEKTTRIQAVGMVPTKPAADLVPGDRVIWNFGYTSRVEKVERVSPRFVAVTLVSTEFKKTAEGWRYIDGATHVRRMKDDRGVAIVTPNPKAVALKASADAVVAELEAGYQDGTV